MTEIFHLIVCFGKKKVKQMVLKLVINVLGLPLTPLSSFGLALLAFQTFGQHPQITPVPL